MNKMTELNKLRQELEEVTKVHDDAYDKITELRDKIHELENELESGEVDRVRDLFNTQKFIRVSNTEIIYVDKFESIVDWDERWYAHGDFTIFRKMEDTGKYALWDVDEFTIGYMSDVKKVTSISKDEAIEIIKNSNIDGIRCALDI